MDDSKRTSLPLLSLDRRGFCSLAAKCALIATAGCDTKAPDPLDEDATPGGNPDAALSPDGSVDASAGADAVPRAGACGMPADYVDCGPTSQFLLGQATFFDKVNYFVFRDEGGLYVLSAKCTHQGAPLQKLADRFHCHAHLSNFTLNGEVVNGPAVLPLDHYDACILPNGNLGVNKMVIVDPSTRLMA